MKRDKNGSLCACLLSKNETQVEVQLGFWLVENYNDAGQSKGTGKEDRFCICFEVERCLTGTLHEFSFIDDCCEAKLLPYTKTALPDDGFLLRGYFLVRLDMRVKQEDNEICDVTVDGNTATCQVSWLNA